MVLITTKEDNRVIMYGESVSYLPNGYPMLVEKNVSFPDHLVNVIHVDETPNDITEDKYCYTEADGFYINPNWEEPNPYNIPNEVYNAIIDDYTDELFEMGVL